MKVEIVAGDNQSKTDIASAIARRWVSNEGVNVIVEGGHTGTALATAEVTKAAGVPFLTAGAAGSDITGKFCHPLVMQFTYDTYALAHELVCWLQRAAPPVVERVEFEDVFCVADAIANCSEFALAAASAVVFLFARTMRS